MGYSKLKNKIQLMKLQHEQERDEMYDRHRKEMNSLLNQCKHTNDDGSSAKVIWEGTSRMHWGYKCSICDKNM